MKTHLFYTFLAIFVATAVVTLLGVTSVITIRDGYLTALVSAFLVELAGAVIAIFKTANFFESEKPVLTAESELRNSIRKLDTAFGWLNDRLIEHQIHIESELMVIQNTPPTPRTRIMLLLALLEKHQAKIGTDVIRGAISAISETLEAGTRIGSTERSSIKTFCASVPKELSGEAGRLLDLLKKYQTE